MPASSAILVGAGDPPAADERRALGELAALVAAAADRRPEVPVVLAGGMSEHLQRVRRHRDAAGRGPARSGRASAGAGRAAAPTCLSSWPCRPTTRVGRSALAAMALAEILDRRVDVVEIGFDGGTRVGAWPGVAGGAPRLDLAIVPPPALAPADPDDPVVDRVGRWSTWGADRHRLRDRLRELRLAPWADATGDGVTLRMAAARAALGRLAEWTPEWNDRPAADLIVATGGAWAVAPGTGRRARPRRRPPPARRRPVRARPRPDPRARSASIPDADERRAMIADLVDDMLAPLGTVVTPAGLRPGRSAGSLVVHGANGATRARPDARRSRADRPAAGDVGRRRVPVPRHGPARRRAAATSRST